MKKKGVDGGERKGISYHCKIDFKHLNYIQYDFYP